MSRNRLTYHEDTEHLGNEPPVTLYTTPVLHQLALRTFDIVHDILGVGIDALNLLTLFRHHLRQLAEDATKFLDCGLVRLTEVHHV